MAYAGRNTTPSKLTGFVCLTGNISIKIILFSIFSFGLATATIMKLWQQAISFPQSHEQQLPLHGIRYTLEPFPIRSFTTWVSGGWDLNGCIGYCTLRHCALFPAMVLRTGTFRSGHQSSYMSHRCWSCHRSKRECFLLATSRAALVHLRECWTFSYAQIFSHERTHTFITWLGAASACSSNITAILDMILCPYYGTICC